MYLPHPSFWPEIEAPPDLIAEKSLFNDHDGNVFELGFGHNK
jgi:hypothetical protein